VKVDRKGNEEPIIIENPFVTLFGGIQPAMLGELGGGMEDGLMDRFLFSYPEKKIVYFSEYETSRESEVLYENLYDSLQKLKPAKHAYKGYDIPRPLSMSMDARRLYKDEYNRISTDIVDPAFPQKMEAQWAKGRGYLARLSLINAVCRCVSEGIPEEKQMVEAEDLEKGISLIRYFQAHAKRVYGIVEDIDPDLAFAADLRDFLQEQPDETWIGEPTEFHETLEAHGVSYLPVDATRLTKKILEISQSSPTLNIQKKRTGAKRSIKVFLQTPDSSVTSVPSVTENPEKGDADDANDATDTTQQPETGSKEAQSLNKEPAPIPEPYRALLGTISPEDDCYHEIPAKTCPTCSEYLTTEANASQDPPPPTSA
jgi:hypothetical protein